MSQKSCQTQDAHSQTEIQSEKATQPIPRGYAAGLEHGFDTDRARLKNLRGQVRRREATLAKLAQRNPDASEVVALRQEIQRLNADFARAEKQLVPWHHDDELLSPKSLLCTPLFSVARTGTRRPRIVMPVPHCSAYELTYQGPELRQTDGLVFMALLFLARDFVPGRFVYFNPQELIESFGHRYGGSERQHLRQTIMRLQEGFLLGPDFRVQLVGMFHYPRHGDWAVKLDAQVMRLFEDVQAVWMDRQLRARLPAGLATWLLGYIRSQPILNETSLKLLQSRCGSPAKAKNFADTLREALRVLEEHGVVVRGWAVSGGKVKWSKGKKG
jgi:hypothetical protein